MDVLDCLFPQSSLKVTNYYILLNFELTHNRVNLHPRWNASFRIYNINFKRTTSFTQVVVSIINTYFSNNNVSLSNFSSIFTTPGSHINNQSLYNLIHDKNDLFRVNLFETLFNPGVRYTTYYFPH